MATPTTSDAAKVGADYDEMLNAKKKQLLSDTAPGLGDAAPDEDMTQRLEREVGTDPKLKAELDAAYKQAADLRASANAGRASIKGDNFDGGYWFKAGDAGNFLVGEGQRYDQQPATVKPWGELQHILDLQKSGQITLSPKLQAAINAARSQAANAAKIQQKANADEKAADDIDPARQYQQQQAKAAK